MNTTPRRGYFLVLGLVLLITGCATVTRMPERDADGPWCGPTSRARAYHRRWRNIVDWEVGTYSEDNEWHWDFLGLKGSGEHGTWYDSKDYLKSLRIATDIYRAYPGERAYDRSLSDPALATEEKQRFPRSHTVKMVAVDPIVIVAVPVCDKGWPCEGRTRLPYHPLVTWFSPDLRVGPLEPEEFGNDGRRIPVSWGWLVLTQEANEWVVKAQPK